MEHYVYLNNMACYAQCTCLALHATKQNAVHRLLTQTQKEKWTPKNAPDARTSGESLSKRRLSTAKTVTASGEQKAWQLVLGHLH